MVNKLKINPNTNLPAINSSGYNNGFFTIFDPLKQFDDITPTERCTLYLLISYFPDEEMRMAYASALIGDLSTWYRNINKLIKKGYLVKISTQHD